MVIEMVEAPRREQIKKWFEEHPDVVMTPVALSETLKIPYPTVLSVLAILEASGFVVKLGRGRYKLNPRRKRRKRRKR